MASEPALIRIEGRQRALLASDMHLGGHDPALTQYFLEALETAIDGVTDLFLLGDLFEAWIGDDAADESADALASRLATLARQGIVTRVLRGNRDFLLGYQPAAATTLSYPERARFLPCDEPLVLEAFGRRVAICHGDALCTDDQAFQRVRAQTREPSWREDFLARPLPEREALACGYREASRQSQRTLPAALGDVSQAAVDALLDAVGADVLVHGHTHRPAIHRWHRAGRERERWVLTDWLLAPRRGGFLRIDANGWRALGDWPAPPAATATRPSG